jgi:hypothetical protein
VQFEFGALAPDDVANILYKRMSFDPKQAAVLGWLASGSPIDIFSKAGQYLKSRDMVYDLLSTIKGRILLDLFDYFDKIDKSEFPSFVDMLILMLTDILLLKNNIGTITNSDLKDDLTRLADQFNDRALIAIISVIGQVKKNAVYNVNMNTALKSAFIKIFPYLPK